MHMIEIDQEVFAYVQAKAIPYEESGPNATLRRLFGLEGRQSNGTEQQDPSRSFQTTRRRRKAHRTNLKDLIRAGLIENGEPLYLRDYSGGRVDGYEARVDGKQLRFKGERYSMSELARIGMQSVGYDSNSYRGPKHWYTSDGVSIKDIWEQLVNSTAQIK